MTRRALVVLWLFVFACLAGCGGEDIVTCQPGATTACICADGRAGARRCGDEGRTGVCSCPDGSTPADGSATLDVAQTPDAVEVAVPEPPDAGPPRVNSTVVVLTDVQVNAARIDDDALIFPRETVDALPPIGVGTVLVSATGVGFVRRVTAVLAATRSVRVETVEGGLSDIVTDGAFRLAPRPDVSRFLRWIPPLADGTFERGPALSVRLRNVRPGLDGDWVFDHAAVQGLPTLFRAAFIGNLTVSGDVEVSASVSGSYSWPLVSCRSITEENGRGDRCISPVGRAIAGDCCPIDIYLIPTTPPIPVAIETRYGIRLKAEVASGALLSTTLHFATNTRFAAGIGLTTLGVRPVLSALPSAMVTQVPSFGDNPPVGEVKVSFEPYVGFALYGLAGPEVALSAYVRGNIDRRTCIRAGWGVDLKVAGSVRIPAIHTFSAEFSLPLIEEREFWQSRACMEPVCGDSVCSAGEDYTRCCVDCGCLPGKVCGSSRTCVDCGDRGEPCCVGEVCANGSTCSGGRCVAVTCSPTCAGRCGGVADGCGGRCPAACPAGATCVRDRCLACGRVGQPCCDGACSDGSTCAAGACVSRCVPDCWNHCGGPDGCGGVCPNRCSSSTTCRSAACVHCGRVGEPCCDSSPSCASGAICGVSGCEAVACRPQCEGRCGGAPNACGGTCDALCPRPCAGDLRIGTPCSTGAGACARSGTWACVSGSTVCSAAGGMSSSEVCNNVDDDCNGAVDDNVYMDCYGGPSSTLGVGVCRAGRTQCRSGMFGACVGDVRPSTEVCGNGLDENCDGRDEPCAAPCAGDSRIGAPCTAGAGACARTGTWVCRGGTAACDAAPGPTSTESCTNRLDDDCDGLVDCGDADCATDAACRICMYNGCFDRGLMSGAYCDARARVACGVASGCAVEVGRTDCETLYPHASGSCFGGSCLLGSGSCERGWANCDGDDANGCETNVDASISNCGTCGNRCTATSGTPVCVGGVCSVGSCPAGRGDCDRRTDNGCEVDTNTDNFNCGVCGTICGPGAGCAAGACRCPTGATYCPAGCFDLLTSAGNCGSCGNVCPAGTRCVAGACTSGCPSGQVDCSGACADLQSNTLHCSACHAACPRNAHAIPTCVAGSCGQTCESGFGDCDGSANNGCERDLRGDAMNCGACGRACGTGLACSVGVCGSDPITQVSGSMTHTCALRRSGRVLCFGSGGALGNGGVGYSLSPVLVVGLEDAVQVDVGQYGSCAVRAGGGVVCWGSNNSGMVGDGTTTARLVPTAVVGVTDAVEVSVGYNSVCARRRSGGIMCWGLNSSGQLGNGTAVSSLIPVAVAGISDAAQIAVGRGTACARRVGGTVMCWGSDASGALGDGNMVLYNPNPVAVRGITDAVQIAFESGFGCALHSSGAMSCWGDNSAGQLGDGTTRSAYAPVSTMLGAVTNVAEVAVGEGFTCVRTTSGVVYCWGRAAYGVLGDGTTSDRRLPLTAAIPSGAASIAAGDLHVCAVTSVGGLLCWGNNGGRLGDGTSTDRNTPTAAVGI